MRFSEVLYRLPERDRGSKFAQAYLRSASTSSAAANVIARIQNELEGRLIVLTAIGSYFGPGAGQNFSSGGLELLPPDGNQPSPALFIKHDGTAKAANVTHGIDWSGELIVPPTYWVRASVNFNAGAAANLVIITVHGYTIPIGTLLSF